MAVLKLKATGRKVTGLKFGESFAKEIVRKVAAHVKKHADEPIFVDIDLDGKELGDDGLLPVMRAVLSMLTGISRIATFRLEELNLSMNGLTTAALPLLTQIVKLSALELRSLDLSANNLSVHTEEQAHQWGQFLDSFRHCRVMRRLDWSGNDFSKSLAMEILTRTYFSHPAVDPNELEDVKCINERLRALSLSTNDSSFDATASLSSLSDGVILKRRSGLRSIPYIILRDVGMTDAGALHFSYLLEYHYWPQYLMTALKEGSHAAKIKEGDDAIHAFGLIYVDNPQISPSGLKLLACAEQARMDLAGISELSESVNEGFEDVMDFPSRPRKFSSGTMSFTVRAPVSSPPTGNIRVHDENYRSDMEHLRKKLQRTTIESIGVNGVQLWASALRLMNTARNFMPSVVAPLEAPPASPVLEAPPSSPVFDDANPPLDGLDTHDFPPLPPALPAFPHRTLRILASSEAGTTKTSKSPAVFKTPRGKGLAPRHSSSKSDKSSNYSGKAQYPAAPSSTRIPATQADPPSSTWRGGLPPSIWNRIFRQLATGDGILSTRQCEKVIRYAMDRNMLRVELAAKGKADSVQLWGILERCGCLGVEIVMQM